MVKKIFIFIFLINMIKAETWTNWAKNQECEAKLVKIKSEKEVVAVINKAKSENKKIKAVGTGHSWSNIVCADYILNTDNLNKIISTDLEISRVTVQAGIKVKDLNKELEKLDLCLPNQAAIADQSLAGTVATATHGSGKTGTLASFITEVKLITANGKILTISKKENPKYFKAIRTNIGLLGVVTEMTVQCEKMFKVNRIIKKTTWHEIEKNYKELLEKNDFMQFYWDGSNDKVTVMIHNKSQDSKAENSYSMLSGKFYRKYYEEEIAIPIKNFLKAAEVAKNLVKESLKKNKVFSGITFRFVSAEQDNIMSPASEHDVVYFSITTGTKNYNDFFKKFYDAMLKFGGRPHWGKVNFLNKKDIKKLYGKNFDEFMKIKKELDPGDLFGSIFF